MRPNWQRAGSSPALTARKVQSRPSSNIKPMEITHGLAASVKLHTSCSRRSAAVSFFEAIIFVRCTVRRGDTLDNGQIGARVACASLNKSTRLLQKQLWKVTATATLHALRAGITPLQKVQYSNVSLPLSNVTDLTETATLWSAHVHLFDTRAESRAVIKPATSCFSRSRAHLRNQEQSFSRTDTET